MLDALGLDALRQIKLLLVQNVLQVRILSSLFFYIPSTMNVLTHKVMAVHVSRAIEKERSLYLILQKR